MLLINQMLRDSGMRGFSLQPKRGVDNVYEVCRPDDTIADNLSEGEKNFIAFLYFYHLVHGSNSADGDTREKTVVIDDPVSSMDSSSLFIVSTLVRQMIEICRNNADNRNPVAKGNFINITTDTLLRICESLDCHLEDIMETVDE